MKKRTVRLIGLLTVLAMVLAACGGDDATAEGDADATTTTATTETTETTMVDEEMTDEEMTDEEMTDEEMMHDLTAVNVGDACAAVPADGEGSFDGMADDPAATAASNNPVLSTLVTAVSEAGLVDTLNGDGPFTIFAPFNDAFAAIPAEDLEAILADQELLTSILTFHVVAGESLSLADLAEMDSVTTVNGGDLAIAESDALLSINGAEVICGNVQTANATVHIIDTVLVP